MIIGGLQTGNTRWLAAHLQNAADNETIEHVEATGTIATDIDGALAEFDAIASGTRATEGVYAAFINPPEPLTRRQYAQALAHIEKRLGLTGQPRVVVFHVKDGREHCHAVWSRINAREMKAIHLSHDRQKLRRCARELAAEFGLELPPNLANDRGIERFDEPPQPTRAEKAMEAASGLSREERRSVITACYRASDSAQGFANALEAAGYMLARGDRRAYVVVDITGDVHSLSRQIDGAKTKDVKKKLEGILLSQLPPVERAKALMAQRAAARQDAKRADEKKRVAAKAEHHRLKAVQKKRRAEIDLLWQKMKIRHMHERKVLLAHIKAEKERHIARRHWLAVGLAIYLKKIAVIRQLLEYYAKRRRRTMEEQHRALLDGLKRRHENEAAELRRRYAALDRLERREVTSFGQNFGVVDTGDRHGPRSWRSPVYEISARHIQNQHVSVTRQPVDLTKPVSYLFAHSREELMRSAAQQATEPVHSVIGNSNHDLLWRDFRQNAAEITQGPVTFRFATGKEAGTSTNRNEKPSPPAPPSWPGAP